MCASGRSVPRLAAAVAQADAAGEDAFRMHKTNKNTTHQPHEYHTYLMFDAIEIYKVRGGRDDSDQVKDGVALPAWRIGAAKHAVHLTRHDVFRTATHDVKV